MLLRCLSRANCRLFHTTERSVESAVNPGQRLAQTIKKAAPNIGEQRSAQIAAQKRIEAQARVAKEVVRRQQRIICLPPSDNSGSK